MELEEAMKLLKNNLKSAKEFQKIVNLDKFEYGKDYLLQNEAIETVLQALENYQIKELLPFKDKLNNITATELQVVLQPYYIQKENLEYKDKIINKLRNRLENSIPKEAVEKKIELYKRLEVESFNRNSIEADEYRAIIKILQELLEGK